MGLRTLDEIARRHRMLGEKIGHLTFDELRSIDDALQLVLDLW